MDIPAARLDTLIAEPPIRGSSTSARMGNQRDGGWAGPDQHPITRARSQPRRGSTSTLTPTNCLGPQLGGDIVATRLGAPTTANPRRGRTYWPPRRPLQPSVGHAIVETTNCFRGWTTPPPWRDHSSRCGRSPAGNGTARTPTHDTVNIMPMSYQQQDHAGPAPARAEQVDRCATRKRSDATHDASRISPVDRGTRLAVVAAHRARTNNITMLRERSVRAAGAEVWE